MRTRFVVLLCALLVPVIAFSAWRAVEKQHDLRRARGELLARAVDAAALPWRETVQGARRVLSTLREDGDVSRWTGDALPSEELPRCEDYLRRLLRQLGERYAVIVLVDSQGASRCASARQPGIGFESLLARIREHAEPVVSSEPAMRRGDGFILPAAIGLARNGQFAGMIGIGIAWSSPVATETSRMLPPISLTLIDLKGRPLGGADVLPRPDRLQRAIADHQGGFRGEGVDGRTYEFRLLAFGPDVPLMLAAIPASAADTDLRGPWIDFALIVLTSLVALAALWFGTSRWCLQPLEPIRRFAAAMARGEDAPQPGSAGPPEMRSLAADIAVMAGAIRAREQDLRASLDQRDHMLREIHHRVKNNLQMISSLLSLQSDRIRSPRVRRHFSDAQNRVLALSVLHRHLYERSSWALVDFQAFINDLVRQLAMNRDNPAPQNIRMDIRAPVMAVGPDTAIPVGLIVTEAVGNAFRHAFAGVQEPSISIQATESGGTVEFVVEDNGVGIGDRIVTGEDPGSLGLTLVRGLAMQLGGEAEIRRKSGGGTTVTVRFPLPT
ncbi:MAG: sensor histidine kinase [Reyranellaceae bacterium]